LTDDAGLVRQLMAHDGALLQYEVVGDGAPVAFLHGDFATRTAFARLREALAAHFRLVLRDLRGHEGSGGPVPPGYGLDTTESDDLLEVLDAEGIERAHLVGHSTGGAIAFMFGLRHPERVGGMVLIEPTLIRLLPPDVLAEQLMERRRVLDAAERDGPVAGVHAWLGDLMGPGWQERMRPATLARWEQMAPIALAHARGLVELMVGEDDVRRLVPPTLFLFGSRTAAWRHVLSTRLGTLRPDLTRLVIEDAGHNVHAEQPERANAAIIEFLGEHPSSGLRSPSPLRGEGPS
jgi:3-oxoadipate enol-lactonase